MHELLELQTPLRKSVRINYKHWFCIFVINCSCRPTKTLETLLWGDSVTTWPKWGDWSWSPWNNIRGKVPKGKRRTNTHTHTNCVRAFIYNLVRACFQHHGEQQHLPQHREINTKNKQWNILFSIYRIWKVNMLTWIYWHSQRSPRKKPRLHQLSFCVKIEAMTGDNAGLSEVLDTIIAIIEFFSPRHSVQNITFLLNKHFSLK